MEGIQHRLECPLHGQDDNPHATRTVHLMSQRDGYKVELHRCEHCGRSALIETRQPLGEPK